MRLIDADKIDFKKVFGGNSEFARDIIDGAQRLIDSQPADFDKEKVIKYLSIRKHVAEEDAALYDEVGDTNRAHLKDTIARCYKNAIEIVEKGGIE